MNTIIYKYINLQNLKHDTCGDTAILRMIIELFLEGINEYEQILKTQIPNKNWPELFQATHKIKPNISMFGISSLEKPILELETCFRNEQELNKVYELSNLCKSQFEHVKIELKNELKSMSNEYS